MNFAGLPDLEKRSSGFLLWQIEGVRRGSPGCMWVSVHSDACVRYPFKCAYTYVPLCMSAWCLHLWVCIFAAHIASKCECMYYPVCGCVRVWACGSVVRGWVYQGQALAYESHVSRQTDRIKLSVINILRASDSCNWTRERKSDAPWGDLERVRGLEVCNELYGQLMNLHLPKYLLNRVPDR